MPDAVRLILERNPTIDQLCRNRWVQLAALDPESPRLHLYRDGIFAEYEPESRLLPVVAQSVDWYRGWRQHLGFASIQGQPAAQPEPLGAISAGNPHQVAPRNHAAPLASRSALLSANSSAGGHVA